MNPGLTFAERLSQLWGRMSLYMQQEPARVLLELLIIWAVVYAALQFLKGTRGERMVKAVAVVLVVALAVLKVAGGGSSFERLGFLAEKFLAWATLAVAIIFAPELRRALARLGEARLFGGGRERKARVIEELLGSTDYLSRHKIGMLVAIERQVGLGGVVEAGTEIDAHISRELLNTIFWPGSALHDLGVVIRDDRLVAAAVQFPLAEGESISTELGSRHRSALGLTMETDALVVVVSEETGTISVAERGVLRRNFTIDGLREYLHQALGGPQADEPLDRATPKTEPSLNDGTAAAQTSHAPGSVSVDKKPSDGSEDIASESQAPRKPDESADTKAQPDAVKSGGAQQTAGAGRSAVTDA